MLYLRAKSHNHELQLMVNFRARNVFISVLCILNHHYYLLKFQHGLC
jgi:hypothetical protein